MLKISKGDRLNWNDTVVELVPYELNGKRWNDLFDDEDELIEFVKEIDIKLFKKRYHGSSYIRPFKEVLEDGNSLSSKQMVQLKRLSSNIFCYHWNKNNLNGV